MNFQDNIRKIKGIGEKRAEEFAKLGIFSVKDLLEYYPRSYETYEEPITVQQAFFRDFASIRAVIMDKPATRYVKKLQITTCTVRDEIGSSLRLTWFNMPYLSKTLVPGNQYVFRGKLTGYGPLRQMNQPKIIRLKDYETLLTALQPVYPLTKGVSGKMIQDAVRQVFEEGLSVEDTLEAALRQEYGLEDLQDALKEIHFPTGKEALKKARERLVFEEFYRFILGVRRMKETISQDVNTFPIQEKEEIEEFIEELPYELTGAQKKVLGEMTKDMTGPVVMNRLIQGDVGSGKTIVAFLSMYLCALNGYESVLMAPTEVLAAQHYKTFTELSEKYGLGLSVELLTGSMTAKEKKAVYEKIASHSCDLIVGTHALIQDQVHFADLALVITDEQHRFGVNQRKALSEKGRTPHVAVMSATPIPRTLAMILYGDLDISVMDEKPKSRLPIKNALVDIEYRSKAYSFIRKQVEAGHQAYVICPMVEESEAMEGENVVEYCKALRQILPDHIRVEYLHGKMKNEQKEAVMKAFAENEVQVLVSTTVIEVGIDVPNATVMLIENAERFGLAQLHQLRGRIGRGQDQSYCIFVDTTQSEDSRKRLEVLTKSNDGFLIASEDLKMRGPGDFFGIRQSGDLSFKLGDIYTDASVLQKAEEAASRTLTEEKTQKIDPVL